MTKIFSLFSLIQLSFYATALTLLSQRSHFLMTLLSLEGMMLSLVLFIPSIMYVSHMLIPTISIIMLTFGACEASLGLGILVFMSRSYGSDMMKSLSMNKC